MVDSAAVLAEVTVRVGDLEADMVTEEASAAVQAAALEAVSAVVPEAD